MRNSPPANRPVFVYNKDIVAKARMIDGKYFYAMPGPPMEIDFTPTGWSDSIEDFRAQASR